MAIEFATITYLSPLEKQEMLLTNKFAKSLIQKKKKKIAAIWIAEGWYPVVCTSDCMIG